MKAKLFILLFLHSFLSYSQQQDDVSDFTILKESPTIQFVGTGEVQQSLSSGTPLPVNTGIGVIYKKEFLSSDKYHVFSTQLFELDVAINVASTTDTIDALYKNGIITNNREFGTFINSPINSKQGGQIHIKTYFTQTSWFNKKLFIDGLNAGIVAANQIWALNDSTEINASSISVKAGIFWDFIPREYLEDYSISFGIDPVSLRFLAGDIVQDVSMPILQQFLNSKSDMYWGPEFHFILRLKNIEAGIDLPIILLPGTEVPGLSKGQLIFSIKFKGGFGLALNQNESAVSPSGEDVGR